MLALGDELIDDAPCGTWNDFFDLREMPRVRKQAGIGLCHLNEAGPRLSAARRALHLMTGGLLTLRLLPRGTAVPATARAAHRSSAGGA